MEKLSCLLKKNQFHQCGQKIGVYQFAFLILNTKYLLVNQCKILLIMTISCFIKPQDS